MKLFHDSKKPFNYIQKSGFLIVFLALVFSPLYQVFGQSAEELNSKINQKNTEIARLEAEIAAYQTQLESIGKEKNSLNNSIKALDITRKKLSADISVTEDKIESTNFKIQVLSSQIDTKQNAISVNVNAIASQIKQVNEYELESVVEMILSENDFSEVWNDVDSIAAIEERIRQLIVELRQAKVELEDTRTETVAAKNELIALKSKLADQKKIVDQNTKEKQKLLAQTKNNEANYQKLVADRQAKKAAFEKELRDYESQLKYVLDPSKLPAGGVLSWPLDNVVITQLFGKTEAGKRLYASGSHNGVDFRAAVGTPVKAMADGVVAGTGDTDLQCPGVSFGRFVLIKYNNGLASTFGHFSLVTVSTGQKVSRGQVVGYSGNTGYSTGPHLHVSVYARDAVDLKTLPSKSCPGRVLTQPISAVNAYLDPMIYLPAKK